MVWYTAAKPSEKSITKLKQSVYDLLQPSQVSPWEDVRDALNVKLRGWRGYFSYGSVSKAYRRSTTTFMIGFGTFCDADTKLPPVAAHAASRRKWCSASWGSFVYRRIAWALLREAWREIRRKAGCYMWPRKLCGAQRTDPFGMNKTMARDAT
jgi:hypothetical protein